MDDTEKDRHHEDELARGQPHARHGGVERFFSPERRRYLDPELVLERLGLEAGMVVADVGSGPGYFALPAAKKVGPTGRVYAFDVDRAMLDELLKRAEGEGLQNVEVVPSEEDRLPLGGGIADVALLANVLHEARRPDTLLREVARLLKSGGHIGVVEWKKESKGWGPPEEHRLADDRVEEMLKACGCDELSRFDVGPHHYGLIARVP